MLTAGRMMNPCPDGRQAESSVHSHAPAEDAAVGGADGDAVAAGSGRNAGEPEAGWGKGETGLGGKEERVMYEEYCYEPWWLHVVFIGCIVLLAILLFMGLIRFGNELSFPGEQARIEQLREDVNRVAAAASEDLIGQVAHWNQEIKAAKRYRKTWWGRLCVPAAWEDVDVIGL